MVPIRWDAASINVGLIPRLTSSSSIRPALDYLDNRNRISRPTAQPRQTFFGIPASEPVKHPWWKQKGLREDESLKESVTPRHFTVRDLVSGSLHRECAQRAPAIQTEPHALNFHAGSAKNSVNRILLDAKFP